MLSFSSSSRDPIFHRQKCVCVCVVQCKCVGVFVFCLKLFNIFSRKIRHHHSVLPQVRAISFFFLMVLFFFLTFFLGSVFKSFTSLGLIFFQVCARWLRNGLLWVRDVYLWSFVYHLVTLLSIFKLFINKLKSLSLLSYNFFYFSV